VKTIRPLWQTESTVYAIEVNFFNLSDDGDIWADEWYQLRNTPLYNTIAEAYAKVKSLPESFFEDKRVRITRIHQTTKVTTTRYFTSFYSEETTPEVQP